MREKQSTCVALKMNIVSQRPEEKIRMQAKGKVTKNMHTCVVGNTLYSSAGGGTSGRGK